MKRRHGRPSTKIDLRQYPGRREGKSVKSVTGLGIPGFETITVLDDARDTAIRARNTRTGDEVVIKLLDRAKEPILPKRFDRSRRGLLNLTKQHIGLVPVLGNGVASDGRDYVISPYYNLGSLQNQIAAGPTPWHLAAELLSEIAKIVGTVHAEGLSLSDIRPSNILLKAVRQPAVAAFGVATRRFDDGGPVFSAPESTALEPEFSAAADVYSLTLVFGALVAGRPRMRSESNDEFLTELRALAPERILDVIEHGLAESPTNRYRDAETMQRAIRAAIEAEPDAPIAVATEEPFNLDDIFGSLEDHPPPSARSAPSDSGPLESLPPGLEDITFASTDGLNGHEPAIDDPRLELPSDLSDLTFAPNSDRGPDIDDIDDIESTGDFPATELEDDLEVDDGGDGPIFDLARETDDLDDELLDLIGLEADQFENGDDRPGGGSVPQRQVGSSGAPTGTLIQEIDLPPEQISEGVETGNGLVAAEASLEDQTSVLQLDQLSQDADDRTSVLNLNDLREGEGQVQEAEDQTGVLSFEELARYEESDDQTSVLNLNDLQPADDTEDQTRVLDLDDLAPEPEDDSDHTSVLNLLELEDGSDHTSVLELEDLDDQQDAEDQTSVLLLDDIAGYEEADDLTGVLEFDDLEETAIVDLDELAGADEELDYAVSEAAFADDRTDIFGDGHDAVDLPSEHNGGLPAGAAPFAAGAAAFDQPVESEEIPFQSVDRGRILQEHSTWPDRARVALEVAWFRSRRAVATTAALLGLVAIGAVVVYFLAQEVRSSTKIEAEGIHQASSTTLPDSPTTFVATNVPYAVDRPARRTTTTLAPFRPAATTLVDAEEDDAAGQDPETPGRQETPGPEQPPPSELLPPTTVDEPKPPTTVVEVPPPPTTVVELPLAPTTVLPPPAEPPTTKKKKNKRNDRTTTEAPPVPTAPPPTRAPPVTPPPTEPPDDDDDDDPVAAFAPSASLNVGTVGRQAARIRVNSNQCVATRFVLSGSDGSGQEGSTSSFDPSVSCSNGWNLNFTGSSGLESGTTYTLTVWVKAVETELTSNTSVSFTTAV